MAASAQEKELAQLIVTSLNLEVSADEIEPEAPLYGEGLGLDSIDILELSLAISKTYGVQLKSDDADNSIADRQHGRALLDGPLEFVHQNLVLGPGGRPPEPGVHLLYLAVPPNEDAGGEGSEALKLWLGKRSGLGVVDTRQQQGVGDPELLPEDPELLTVDG